MDSTRAQRPGRDPWWDNARFVAATLIVVLHTVGSLMARHDSLHAFHIATWALRVPLFVLLAGVFSSGAPLDTRRLRDLIRTIVLPALLFSLLFSVESYLLGAPFRLHVVQLPWTLWFLMSLVCWRLLLPLVLLLRYPLAVTGAIALAVGYVPEFGMNYSASRTLVYLPLFLLGHRIGRGAWKGWFTARWSAPVAAAGLLVSFVAGALWHHEVKGTWTSMRHPYVADDPLGMAGGWVIRLLVLAAALAMVLCLLRLVPRRRLPLISALGAGGFTIYLLHPLVILPLRELGFLERADTPLELAGLVLFGVALTAVLGSSPVRRLTRPLTRPDAAWLLAPEKRTPPAPRTADTPPQLPEAREPAAPVGAAAAGSASAPGGDSRAGAPPA